MKRNFAAPSIAMTALLTLGASQSSAGERCASGCIAFAPAMEVTGSMTLDAGGFSKSTGEHLDQSSAFFEAHVERPDGSVHPDYGPGRRPIYIFKTMTGDYVLRVQDAPGRVSN